MFGGGTDFLSAFHLFLQLVLTMFHDSQHSQDTINGRTKVMRHVGEKFAFC